MRHPSNIGMTCLPWLLARVFLILPLLVPWFTTTTTITNAFSQQQHSSILGGGGLVRRSVVGLQHRTSSSSSSSSQSTCIGCFVTTTTLQCHPGRCCSSSRSSTRYDSILRSSTTTTNFPLFALPSSSSSSLEKEESINGKHEESNPVNKTNIASSPSSDPNQQQQQVVVGRQQQLQELVVVEKEQRKPNKKPKKKRKQNMRMQIFSFINLPRYEVLTLLAVLLSCFLVAIDTLDNLPTEAILIHNVLDIINVILALDFFVRWYAAGNFKTLYLRKPLVLLDIVVVLIPLLLGSVMPIMMNLEEAAGFVRDSGNPLAGWQFDSSGLQNLLLLRIFRLRRVLTDINTFVRFQVALGVRIKPQDVRPYQLQLARVLLSVFTLLSVASGLIYTTEHQVNPNIPDYFAALYFGLTTLTTVGFGDIAPITPEGRFVVSMSILAGVAVIPGQAANLLDAILQFQDERKRGGPRIRVTAPPSPSPPQSSSSSILIKTTEMKTTIDVDKDDDKNKSKKNYNNGKDTDSVVLTPTLSTSPSSSSSSAAAAASLGNGQSPSLVMSPSTTSSTTTEITPSESLPHDRNDRVAEEEKENVLMMKKKDQDDDVKDHDDDEMTTIDDDNRPYIGWMGRCCLECEALDHREDAIYCWSCGTKL